ncbi:hypothetical protein HPB49_004247 [Dermacentor silvarum]|uniref:Uncharacterized protein n=1 Tax=Dermacentor silvarum TaxID=543639 RepID=A0ACB8DUM9_DERSI|nr:hypothetical protein HPB49_004247 [Dermacentor silvarum]
MVTLSASKSKLEERREPPAGEPQDQGPAVVKAATSKDTCQPTSEDTKVAENQETCMEVVESASGQPIKRPLEESVEEKADKRGRPAKLFDETNPDWAPNKLLGHGCEQQSAATKSARFDRRKMRAAKNAAVSAVGALSESCEAVAPSMGNTIISDAAHTEEPSSPVHSASPDCSFTAADRDAATQTDVTVADLKALEEDNRRLTSELHAFEIQKSQLEITESSLREDPEKVCFYTGLPSFTVLFAIYQLIEQETATPTCVGKDAPDTAPPSPGNDEEDMDVASSSSAKRPHGQVSDGDDGSSEKVQEPPRKDIPYRRSSFKPKPNVPPDSHPTVTKAPP